MKCVAQPVRDSVTPHYAAALAARREAPVLLPSDDVPAGFVRPFRYDGIFYIWDGNGNMAADFGGEARTLRPRGWGRMTHMDDPEAAMDAWALWLRTLAAGADNDPEEIVFRLNQAPEADAAKPAAKPGAGALP